MISRYTRLRVRRSVRRQQRSIESASFEAGQHFDRHVLGRWANLQHVRRFVVGWLVLVSLLATGVYLQARELRVYYQADVPIAGGTFREGIVGEITNMNPIFATSAADRAAAKLMFSTLLEYDSNNNLVSDLAKSWSVSDDGTIYTVILEEDVKWHDGERFDADDVVFTYETIQHPDTRSYLNASWQDITVQAKDDTTVTFSLPNPYTPFPHSLTTGGILPEHILGDLDPAQLRGNSFNVTNPIGTGPFAFEEIATSQNPLSVLRLDSFEEYFRGTPRLDTFIVQAYSEREQMVEAFLDGTLAAAAGLQTSDRGLLLEDNDAVWYDLPLNNAVYAFFKTSEEILSDAEVRKAITKATDQSQIIELLDSRFAEANGPLLPNHIGYDPELLQAVYDKASAEARLEKAGWIKEDDGIRYKDGEPLAFQMVTQSSDDYAEVAQNLKQQWREVGIDLDVLVVDENAIQQSHIASHNYQSLLIGVTIGNDPDVFVYWHSSQSGVNGFNLSEYENETADTALEAGRTRSDEAIRAAKYKTFLEEWRADAPAIALYQPGYSYVQRNSVSNFDMQRITSPDDRFSDVHLWRVNTRATKR